MARSTNKTFIKQYKLANKLLTAVKNSAFQFRTTPKISKAALIKFFETVLEGLNMFKYIHAYNEINILEKLENDETKSHIEMTTIDGKVLRIFTREQLEKLKEEFEEIEEYYPGENALTEYEKMCKPFYSSLHDFQYFISTVRKGKSETILNEDGSITRFATE